MRYFAIILVLLILVYPFSFMRFCIKKKQWSAAIGTLLLILLSITAPVFVIFFVHR